MKIEKFLEGITSIENCATCKFFASELVTFSSRKKYANGGIGRRVVGVCRRYPPQFSELKFEDGALHVINSAFPTIDVEVCENQSDDGQATLDVISETLCFETPWCGEYRENLALPPYFEGDAF